ncbi:MAG: glycosyltransferase family 2 protein [Rothia sp. (in: high G+C Gram-positive bacteria)]|nr:glycosyltransferase family 2 protein [Rothia sp. (in: high G+C Gram-positive bacteria)]
MPKLSVLIPFYGDPADTLDLIDQVRVQATDLSVEVVISDDASPIIFPQIEGTILVRREINGGFGANVNTGVAASSGEWVLILNSDLTLPSSFLTDMLAAAEEESHRGSQGIMLSPQIIGHNGESQWVGRHFPKTRHHAWEWFTPASRLHHTRFWHALVGHNLACTTGKRAEPDWLMGACMMLRKEDFDVVGGMDERFFMNSEEIDLQRRLCDKGIKRVFRGDIVVEHIGGGSSGASAQRRQWVLDSRFIYNAKWKEGKYLAAALRVVTASNFLFNSIRALRNRDVKPLITLRKELAYIKKAESKR